MIGLCLEPRGSDSSIHGEEAVLVRAAKAGDRAAFGELYRQYARTVHGLLLAHVAPADADDLTQIVFVKALEQLASLREARAFGGWLSAIARHTATDFHRQRRTESLPPEQAGGARPDKEAFAVLEAIRSLPEAYRWTLILRLVEGMTGPEIAARTGLTPESVRVNLCRGMRRLREALGARM